MPEIISNTFSQTLLSRMVGHFYDTLSKKKRILYVYGKSGKKSGTVLLKKFSVESHITVGFSAFLSNIGM